MATVQPADHTSANTHRASSRPCGFNFARVQFGRVQGEEWRRTHSWGLVWGEGGFNGPREL